MVYKQRGRPPSTETLVRRQLGLPPKNAKQSLPAGDSYIIPNHSGIASHPEFKKEIGSISLSGLKDTTITSPTNNSLLYWNGSSWVDLDQPTTGISYRLTRNSSNVLQWVSDTVTIPSWSSVLSSGNTSGSFNARMSTNKKMEFRDTGIYLNSPADGELNIVSDNILETQATEYQSDRTQSVAPTRSLNTTYQATNSSILVYGTVRCLWSDDSSTPNNVAYATCKTDGSSPPTTAVQTAGTNTAFYLVTANTFAQQDFAFSFFVKKGDYYRIDTTTIGGTTVTKIHWNEVAI